MSETGPQHFQVAKSHLEDALQSIEQSILALDEIGAAGYVRPLQSLMQELLLLLRMYEAVFENTDSSDHVIREVTRVLGERCRPILDAAQMNTSLPFHFLKIVDEMKSNLKSKRLKAQGIPTWNQHLLEFEQYKNPLACAKKQFGLFITLLGSGKTLPQENEGLWTVESGSEQLSFVIWLGSEGEIEKQQSLEVYSNTVVDWDNQVGSTGNACRVNVFEENFPERITSKQLFLGNNVNKKEAFDVSPLGMDSRKFYIVEIRKDEQILQEVRLLVQARENP